jgi:DNA-binding transcriptional LysR family regulator
MEKLGEIDVFLCILHQGSLTAASSTLGSSIAVVSRALNLLEVRFGAPFVQTTMRNRLSRPATLTISAY